MIKYFRIRNFKCFQDTGRLDIRPLTFLVGPNSSGKTSIKHFLAMLSQTFESTNNSPLTTKGKLIDVGPYEDFVFKKNIKNELSFEIVYDTKFDNESAKSLDISQNVQTKFSATLFFDNKIKQIKLKKYKIECDYIYEEIKFDTKKNDYYAIIGYYDNKLKKMINSRLGVRDINKFYNFYPNLPKLSKKRREILIKNLRSPLYTILPDTLRILFTNLFYLGPLREYPQRFYTTTGEEYKDVGLKGERTIDVLWHDSVMSNKNNLIKTIEYWFKQFGISKTVKVSIFKKNYVYSLTLKDSNTGTNVNIADVGFGSSQILPIITECFLIDKHGTVLIEQPEIHLHPRAQSIVGDIFVKAIKNNSKRFIIETHSEHLLNRIRRRIAEGIIKNSDVAIYYFNPTNAGAQIKEIKVSEIGEYIDYPKGFFEEGFTESYEIIKAMNKRRNKNV